MKTFRKVDVPEGRSGVWEVSCFTPQGPEAFLHNLKQPSRSLVEGETYTKLTCNGQVVMSDTPAEIRDHYPLLGRLCGRMLFNGLGIGVVVIAEGANHDA